MTITAGLARLLAPLILTFALAVPAHAQQAQAIPDPVRTSWRFDRSDLSPHPGVRFGVLAN